MNKRNTLTKKTIRLFIPLCPTGISPNLGAKHHPECPNTGDGPQGYKQPDGNCSPKVGELPERVRGMNNAYARFKRNRGIEKSAEGVFLKTM